MKNVIKHIHLNGWQRLWVFTIMLNLVVTCLITLMLMPKKSEIIKDWLYATVNSVPALREQSIDEIKNKYKGFDDRALISVIHKKYLYSESLSKSPGDFNPFIDLYAAPQAVFDNLDKEYEKKLTLLQKEQLTVIRIGALYWFISSVVIYMIGWGIGWVYRGFKN